MLKPSPSTAHGHAIQLLAVLVVSTMVLEFGSVFFTSQKARLTLNPVQVPANASSPPLACVVNTADNNLKIYNLTNPVSPTLRGSIALGDVSAFVVTCKGNYAYVGTVTDLYHYQGNMKIFDLSNPTPVLKSTVGAGADPREIFISGNYAYVTNRYTNGFQIFDVSNKSAPILKSTTTIPGPGNDGSSYVSVGGNYAYVSGGHTRINGSYLYTGNGEVIKVYDVADPVHPVLKTTFTVQPTGSTNTYFNVIDISNPISPVSRGNVSGNGGALVGDIAIKGSRAYTVSGVTKRLQVFDITIPSSPVWKSSAVTGDGNDDTRAISISGDYAYVVNWGHSMNMKVFNISSQDNPSPVGSVVTGNAPTDIDTTQTSGGSSSTSSSVNLPPPSPLTFSSHRGQASIDVLWSAVAGATRYRIYRTDGGVNAYETSTTYHDTNGILFNTQYYYKAQSCTATACGDWSSQFSHAVNAANVVSAQCSDGTDNDGDGKIDYPADCGCTDANDTTEIDTVFPPPPGC